MIFGGQEDIPSLFSPFLLEEYLFERSHRSPGCDRIGFAQEPLMHQLSPICYGLRLGGSLFHTCGPSFSGNRKHVGASAMCTCVQGDTASLASAVMAKSLDLVSKNLAAICEAEAPRSVTALYPLSSATLSSRSTTLFLCVWRCLAS